MPAPSRQSGPEALEELPPDHARTRGSQGLSSIGAKQDGQQQNTHSRAAGRSMEVIAEVRLSMAGDSGHVRLVRLLLPSLESLTCTL